MENGGGGVDDVAKGLTQGYAGGGDGNGGGTKIISISSGCGDEGGRACPKFGSSISTSKGGSAGIDGNGGGIEGG